MLGLSHLGGLEPRLHRVGILNVRYLQVQEKHEGGCGTAKQWAAQTGAGSLSAVKPHVQQRATICRHWVDTWKTPHFASNAGLLGDLRATDLRKQRQTWMAAH
jgi:hypothetical protein